MLGNNAQQDARFSDIGPLPSNFIPYMSKTEQDTTQIDFCNLLIRPFSIHEIKLISKAIQQKDYSNLIRAVDMCIDQDVNCLTTGDFYYLLFWLRVNSYPKSPIVVPWTCTQQVDENGSISLDYGVSKTCGMENTQNIQSTSITVIELDEEKAKNLDPDLDYPRVATLNEMATLAKVPELANLVYSARWIKKGRTIKEKIAYLETLPDLTLFDTAMDTNETLPHGVSEYVNLTCAKCKANYRHELKLDPFTFFRKQQ